MSYLWLVAFGGILGAVFGSFFGVVIDRSDCEVSQTSHSGKFAKLRDRSRCGSCRQRLRWWENIPVLSFIFLRGRCRTCRSPIPYWLPLIEIAGAVAAAAILSNLRNLSYLSILSQISIAAALIWIFFSDLVKGLIPDWAVVLGVAGAGLSNLSSAAVAAAFFWLLVIITRGRGMGTGDVTLAFFLGLWLGWPKIAAAVWLAFLLGGTVALFAVAFRRKKFGQTVPFGPFLIIGAMIAKIWGLNLLELFLTI